MVYQMERQIWLNRGIWYRRHNKNLVVKNLSQNSVNNGYDSSKNILMYYFWAQYLAEHVKELPQNVKLQRIIKWRKSSKK